MIWLTWRQFRTSAATVLGALACVAVALAVTGPELAEILRVSGQDFFDRLGTDGTKQALFAIGTAVTYAVPAVVGAFWGAPMVAREIEAGTHRLVWSQSITRTHWLATKLGLAGVGAVVAGSIGLGMTWWSGPIDDAVSQGYSDNQFVSVPRIWPDLIGSRGVIPIGMAVLALAVGVTAGLLIRRTVPAMAVTFVAVVGIQVAVPLFLQSHLVTPETVTTTITASNLRGLLMEGEPGAADPLIGHVEVAIDEPGAWVTENHTLDSHGEAVVYLPPWAEDCAQAPGTSSATAEACFTRLADEGYRQEVQYVPASRFWRLQWIETSILLGLTLGLVGFCFRRIRQDLV